MLVCICHYCLNLSSFSGSNLDLSIYTETFNETVINFEAEETD